MVGTYKRHDEVITVKLFIIGNGFDRGHRLPTSYWDFRTYLEVHYPQFLRSFEEHYDLYPSDDYVKQQILWNELESNLANIDEDTIKPSREHKYGIRERRRGHRRYALQLLF